jgi:hypothetical protein
MTLIMVIMMSVIPIWGMNLQALEPVLAFNKLTTRPHTAELTAQLNQNPSPLNIANLTAEVMPLNTKHKRTVSMAFYHVLRHQGKLAAEKDDQFLLFVTGEGGTGKSWIIDAVRLGMKLLERDQEVLVIAPTGNAAKHVQGSTIHTGLDMPFGDNANEELHNESEHSGPTRPC